MASCMARWTMAKSRKDDPLVRAGAPLRIDCVAIAFQSVTTSAAEGVAQLENPHKSKPASTRRHFMGSLLVLGTPLHSSRYTRCDGREQRKACCGNVGPSPSRSSI